jgi:protein farnesyltransferase subunit beta
MALTTIGNEFAYRVIDRKKMYRFLMSLKQKDGSFVMHEQGEVDVRASFCALAIASVCNLLTEELVENCGDFLVKCQTYEGGFGGEPGNEAHGGYTFCSVAALKILGETHKIMNRDRLMKWAIDRQMNLEGGFQGRTNKLVDGCYSFWVGGIFAIFQEDFFGKGDEEKENSWLFDEDKLQRYLIQACQHPKGGLIDKPGKYD